MGQSNGKEKADSGNHSVDGGFLIPQGVYTSAQDYDHAIVKNSIQTRKLAPFYPGLDDEEAYAQAPYNTECPICFLYYPSPLNQTRCCSQQICTECFVQIKRADPNSHTPPSSEPASCPFCQETNFGIRYKAPPPGVMEGEYRNAAGVAEGADAARERAVDAAEGGHLNVKRKSFSHQDPEVVTIDFIRPDWQAKLAAAEAATTRRANRRIIMRQVGDRLIPVGVSSSRLGSEFPAGSSTGPGGAIIIGENSRWGGGLLSGVGGTGREGRSGRGRRDLTQILQGLGDGGVDMEEVMMMEAMRLSLLEHEEEQRRQAQAQSAEERQNNASSLETSGTAPSSAKIPDLSRHPESTSSATATATSSSQQQQTQPRTSSLASEVTTAPLPNLSSPRHSLSHRELGISNSRLAELSELVEGGLPISSQTVEEDDITSIPPSLSHASRFAASQDYSSAPHSPTMSNSPMASPVGSPGRIGSNPNNPFRRFGSSTGHSPIHSRHASSLYNARTHDSQQDDRNT